MVLWVKRSETHSQAVTHFRSSFFKIMRFTVCRIIVLWGKQCQAMLSTLTLLREWEASFKHPGTKNQRLCLAETYKGQSKLSQSLLSQVFTCLGQAQQQVLLYICCVLWKHLLTPTTWLRSPVTSVTVTEVTKYKSCKLRPPSFWDYSIFHFLYFLQMVCLLIFSLILSLHLEFYGD